VPGDPGWGAPRIHGGLLKLGIDIGESSVSKYMVRSRRPPSQTWRTFLENHAQQLVSIDFGSSYFKETRHTACTQDSHKPQ